jgi:hypothetical protein
LITLGVLGFIKIVGVMVALVSSAIAAIMDLKDARGALTFWGRINIGGILFGGFLAISAQLVENSAKQDETLASLRDIERILHPLSQISAGFSVRVENQTPAAQKFLNSVWDVVNSLRDNPCTKQRVCKPEEGVLIINNFGINNEPQEVSVFGTSALFPLGDDLESRDLTQRAMELRFHKAGGFLPDPKSEDVNWLMREERRPDLSLVLHANIHEDGFLRVRLSNNELQQVAEFVGAHILAQTGDISSILDLAKANLVVQGANLFKGKF